MDKIEKLKKVITDLKESSLTEYTKRLKNKENTDTLTGEIVAFGIILMKIKQIFKS